MRTNISNLPFQGRGEEEEEEEKTQEVHFSWYDFWGGEGGWGIM